MAAFVPELIVIAFAAAAVGAGVLYIRHETAKLDQRHRRRT